MPLRSKYSQMIKTEALRLGFASVGIAKAEVLTEERSHISQWLSNGFHGEMSYMENHFDKRLDPTLLVPGAQSVIVLSHNYFPESKLPEDAYAIARYAYGEDYHTVLKDKMQVLVQFIESHIGAFKGRVFTDSAPVLERAWAVKAGLGWQGKNTLLIQKGQGSYFFLAEIILDLPLTYDAPFTTDHCGTCTRCIDACPTDAIAPSGYLLDASKCISYLTIELKEEIPKEFKGKMENWAFGCDICQEVCPWNRFSKQHQEPSFAPHPDLLGMTSLEWQEITTEVFARVFKGTAVKRTKFQGLRRNIDFLKDADD